MPAKIPEPEAAELEKLGSLQCTYEELAAWFKCDRRTIIRWMKKPALAEAFERGKANGRISLRRAQFQSALGSEKRPGSYTMQIWLGKQLLGQKDQVETTNTVNVTDKRANPTKNMSADDLRTLEAILSKAATASEPSAADDDPA